MTRSPTHRITRSTGVVTFLGLWLLAAALLTPRHARAQPGWATMSGLGYGGLGVGAAVLYRGGLDSGLYAFDHANMIGLVGGLAAGYFLGSSAEDAARVGEGPSPAHLWGVRLGTVAGGATVGAGLAGLWVTFTGNNGPGDDERLILTSAVLGAVGGLFLEWRIEAGLRERSVTPTVGPSADGGLRVGVAIR